MKVREAIKLIEADGWFEVATRGSHRQYRHATKLVVEIIRLSPVVMPVLRNVSAVFCADVRVPSV